MKKAVLLLPILILLGSIIGIFVLEEEKKSNDPQSSKNKIQALQPQTLQFDQVIANYFSLDLANAIEHEKLKIYPIVASENYLNDHATVPSFTNLATALQDNKIQILEVADSERDHQSRVVFNPNPMAMPIVAPTDFPDPVVERAYANGATVNTLTIENTSDDTIYIMAGEVIQGGRQDRVIAEDVIAMPHSGKIAVPVFCVEPSRWSYRDASPETPSPDNEPAQATNDKIYAFTGHFNTASNSIRQTVKHEKNQSEVWAKVGDMRTRHNVAAQGSTYGDLATATDFVQQRDAYLNVLANAFASANNADAPVIGCVVVSGDKVLGCDIFATPALFDQQYPILLHAYVSEAITYGATVQNSDALANEYFQQSFEKYFARQKDEKLELELKFVNDNKVIHFTDI